MPRARRKLSPSQYRDIGFLLATTPDEWDDFTKWFEGALKPDIRVNYLPPQGASGDPKAIAGAAKDLAKYYPVIVTASTAAALALKKATKGTNVQFVYASAGDPVSSGLSPQPGGNYTGGSNGQADSGVAVPRRVKRMVDNTAKFKPNFAVVGDYSDKAHKAAMKAVYSTLTQPPFSVPVPIPPSDPACLLDSSVTDFDAFMSNLAAAPNNVKSLYVCSDLWITVNAKALNRSAHRAGIKVMFEFKQINQNGGGDDSDQNSWEPLFTTAADYVDQILNGKNAGDLKMYALAKKTNRRRR